MTDETTRHDTVTVTVTDDDDECVRVLTDSEYLEGYLEGYQRTASPRPEGELLPIAYRIAPLNGRLK